MNNTNYLYYINIENLSDDDFKKGYCFVSEERKNKINKYRNIQDKKLSLCSELLLRYILNDFNIISKFEYYYNDNNKPYLKDLNYYFNISHCKDYVICAFSKDEIGCDIEKIREIDMNIVKKYFNSNEVSEILSLKDEKQKESVFFRYWTLKESFIKNIGKGLSYPLNEFSINIDKEINIIQSYNNDNYYFEEFFINSNYKCSICKHNNNKTKLIKVNIDDLKTILDNNIENI